MRMPPLRSLSEAIPSLETLADRIQITGVVGRLQVYVMGVYFAFLSFVPTTNLGKSFDLSGAVGDVLGTALLLTCALGLIDGLVNDIMTDRWVLGLGLRYRHYLLMSAASFYGVSMFMVYGTPTGYGYVYLFLIQATFACLAALLDIRRRFKKV